MKPPTSSWRRGCWALLKFVRLAAIAYLLVLLFLMIFEESLIFFPTRYPDGQWNPSGLAFEDAWFESADGTRLHGWYVPHERPRAFVLFATGNAGNITYRIDKLQGLHRAGAAVMIFGYRGYGRSEGRPDEPGIVADARAARRWLAKRAGLQESQIVLLGESIGGAVMVDLASKEGARGLVLESAFTSLADVAAIHYPMFPARLLMRNRLDALSKIADYQGPLLVCHGDADQIIPIHLGQRLFDAANEPKRFVRLKGHDHNDPLPAEFYEAFEEFIERLP